MAILLVVAFAACGDDDVVCGPGTTLSSGICEVVDGGVAADADCGDGGCASALPSDGRTCAGRFGPVPEGAPQTIYVEASAMAGGDGSSARPLTSLQAAIDAATSGGVVAIAGGRYPGAVRVAKPLTIEGRCAREVVIAGSVEVVGTGDVAIRGVTVTAGSPGIALRAAPGVELRHVRVSENSGAGVVVDRSRAAIIESEIHATTAVAGSLRFDQQGSGVFVLDGSNLTSSLSIVDMNRNVGIDIADVTGTTDTTPVLTAASIAIVDMNLIANNGSDGIRVHPDLFGAAGLVFPAIDAPATQILSTTLSGNQGHGVSAEYARVTMIGSVLRGNLAMADDSRFATAFFESRVVLAGNRWEAGLASGIELLGCQGTVSANRLSGLRGVGIEATGSELLINGNEILGNGASGIALTGGIAIVDMNYIADSGADSRALPGMRASAISIRGGSKSEVRGNIIDRPTHAGIALFRAPDVQVRENRVSGARALAGLPSTASGHGIYAVESARVAITENQVSGNQGAGISLDRIPDGAGDLFIVDMNLVTGNGFAGINVQDSGPGRLLSNGVADNQGSGVRLIRVNGPAPVAATVATTLSFNTVRRTTASGFGNDGDGIAAIGTKVEVRSNSGVDGNARAGFMGSGGAIGIVDMNLIGIVDMNLVYDVIAQSSPGLSFSANTTARADVISATDLVAINMRLTALAEVP